MSDRMPTDAEIQTKGRRLIKRYLLFTFIAVVIVLVLFLVIMVKGG